MNTNYFILKDGNNVIEVTFNKETLQIEKKRLIQLENIAKPANNLPYREIQDNGNVYVLESLTCLRFDSIQMICCYGRSLDAKKNFLSQEIDKRIYVLKIQINETVTVLLEQPMSVEYAEILVRLQTTLDCLKGLK